MDATPIESRRYACAKCGRKRLIRTTEHWPDYGYAYIGPDGLLCNRCGREMGAIELKRCGKCGGLFRSLRAFFVGPDGRVHLSLDCFIAGSVTSRETKESVMSRVRETPKRESRETPSRETPSHRRTDAPKPDTPKRETPSEARPEGTRECWHCHDPFYPARSDARYCSPRCRVAAHRAHRAKQVARRLGYDMQVYRRRLWQRFTLTACCRYRRMMTILSEAVSRTVRISRLRKSPTYR